jgi:tetratricopeptide (TPR) repeat protein
VAKPKNKSETEPVVGEDELQTFTFRAAQALRPHATKIVVVLAGVVVVIVGLVVWQGMEQRKAAAATKVFADLIERSTAHVEEAGPRIELADLQNPDGYRPRQADHKTFAERNQAALELVRQLEASHGSAKVTRKAQIVEAGLLYDAGKYDEAVTAYRAFLETRPPAELAARAREGIAYSLEAKALAAPDAAARSAGLDEALQAFVALEPDPKGAHQALALYHQGRVTALKGDRPAAAQLFKKALETEPAADLAEEINSRLALLEAK